MFISDSYLLRILALYQNMCRIHARDSLLVIPDAHVDPAPGEEFNDVLDRRLGIVIGEQHLWLDRPRRLRDLLRRHRIRLVAGQKGNVDVLQRGHLRDVLRIAGDINAKAVWKSSASPVVAEAAVAAKTALSQLTTSSSV